MILGIMGGMGPAATCDLYDKITQYTHACTDQEHIHILIDSNVQIPDRTDYICGKGEDPRIEMIRSAIKLEMMGADYIVIACNTAHYFYDDIKKYTNANILHMIRETAEYLKKASPESKDFLLLSTEGTYASGVYKMAFSDYNLNIIEPVEADKQTVMGWIYRVKSGIFDVSKSEFENLVNKYSKDKRIQVILGCTELPVLVEKIDTDIECVDPTLIIAKHCVEIAKLVLSNNVKS